MKPSLTFQAHDSYVLDLRFARGGRWLFSAGMDNVAKLWSLGDASLTRTFSGHEKSVSCLALSPDESTLVTGSSDATVRLWDVATGDQIRVLQDRKRVVSSLSMSAGGEWIAAGSYKGSVALWTTAGESIAAFPASSENIASVAFSPADRTVLATSGLGPDIKIWSLPEGRDVTTLTLPAVATMQVRFTPDGRRLLALTYEGTLHMWETESWTPVATPWQAAPGARLFVLDDPGERCAILSEGRVQIRSLPAWDLLSEFPVAAKVLSSAAFSPSGRVLAVGAADRKIRVWDLDAEALP